MKKSTLKFLAIAMFFLMGTYVMAQTQFEITFQVDMTNADPFDPVTDEVFISGDFAGWTTPGEDVAYKMEPIDVGSLFYTLTISIAEGDILYKYARVINGAATWDNAEWAGDPNRTASITASVIIEDVWADIEAGIFGQPNEFTYSMYPNPVLTVLNIDNTSDVNQVDVYDATGRLVRTVEVTTAKVTIDVAELQTGVYILNVHNEKGTQTSKFIKN